MKLTRSLDGFSLPRCVKALCDLPRTPSPQDTSVANVTMERQAFMLGKTSLLCRTNELFVVRPFATVKEQEYLGQSAYLLLGKVSLVEWLPRDWFEGVRGASWPMSVA